MRHVVLVTPPAIERAGKVWEFVDSRTVVICADHELATLWADAAPPEHRAHAVTGLARTAALLKDGRVGVLAGAPSDLAALVAHAALKLEAIETVVLAWPESFAAEPALETLLGETSNARRVVLSWNPPALTEFLERYARRADVIGNLPLDADGNALAPVGAVRYAVVTAWRRGAAVRDALDALRATRPYVWTGGAVTTPGDADVVVAAALPTRDEVQGLVGLGAGQPVVLALASQLPYLRSIAKLTPIPLPSAADRAQDRSAGLRAQISARLSQGDVDAELAVLAPLFEEHDPAMVAGALLALSRQPSTGAVSVQPSAVSQPVTGWVRVFVSVGRKDRAAAKDLVGALIKEAGLQKGQIGRIDVRDTFSLVDVSPPIADQAVKALTGMSIRGRRVTARLDRA